MPIMREFGFLRADKPNFRMIAKGAGRPV